VAAVLGQILYAERPSPLSLRPDLAPRLAAVCVRAMARDPAERYQSMEVFAAALEDLQLPDAAGGAEKTHPLAPAPPLTRTLEGPPPERHGSSATHEAVPTRRLEQTLAEPQPAGAGKAARRGKMWWLGAGIALLLGGALAVWLVNRPRPAGPAPGEVRVFHGHSDRVVAVALSADGRLALSGSWDRSARLWDVDSGEEVRRLTDDWRVVSVAFSADGRYAAFGLGGGESRMRLLDPVLDPGKRGIIRLLKGHVGYVFSLAFTPDSQYLLSGGGDGGVFRWDMRENARPLQLPGGPEERWVQAGEVQRGGWIRAVGYSPSDDVVVAARPDGTVRQWRAGQVHGQPFRLIDGIATCVAISPDGQQVLLGEDGGSFGLWDLQTRQRRKHFEGHTGEVWCLACSADGRRVLSGGSDYTVRLWDAASGEELHQFSGHEGIVSCVAFSADGRFALSGSLDNTLRLWRLPE
jgi:hypothetical protein